ncbi:MAG TPA: tRNA (adenosine(37)-N6)-threonylcarbamoyltransferase complex ATPase subunit type 1 TsaE [Pricia sp.]|nr:tRNA (adenosine(37)-N6)-threonylcarbamoyltransferase complex ATPase subunit type 1 TsaE [Pricia sp.]
MQITYTESQLQKVAHQILTRVPSKILAFAAPMGAGKTTLIKAMLQELGAADAGSSPSFGIVNEYHDRKGKRLAYHFDFYRLNDETEALDIGVEDYFEEEVYIFIEWPEKIASLLPGDVTEVYIEIVDSYTRRISMKGD